MSSFVDLDANAMDPSATDPYLNHFGFSDGEMDLVISGGFTSFYFKAIF